MNCWAMSVMPPRVMLWLALHNLTCRRFFIRLAALFVVIYINQHHD